MGRGFSPPTLYLLPFVLVCRGVVVKAGKSSFVRYTVRCDNAAPGARVTWCGGDIRGGAVPSLSISVLSLCLIGVLTIASF